MRSPLLARSLLALSCSVLFAYGAAGAEQPPLPAAPPAAAPQAAPGMGITASPTEGAPVELPQRIVYRRTPQESLFVEVSGKSAGADRNIVYPMRRINCETGEAIVKQ